MDADACLIIPVIITWLALETPVGISAITFSLLILTFAESPAAGIRIVSGLCPNSPRLNNSGDANYHSSQDYNEYKENENIKNSQKDHKEDLFETVKSSEVCIEILPAKQLYQAVAIKIMMSSFLI